MRARILSIVRSRKKVRYDERFSRKKKESLRTKRASETRVDSKSGTQPDLLTDPTGAGQQQPSPLACPLANSTIPSSAALGRHQPAAGSSLLPIHAIASPIQRAPSPIRGDMLGSSYPNTPSEC